MDGMRNPVGDEPPETYWRRRLAVIIAGVVLILLVWFLVSATLSDDSDDDPTPGASPTVTTSPDAVTTDASAPDRACTEEDITVSAQASPTNVNVGSTAAFEVSVEHTGDSACSLSSNADGTAMEIRSGEDVYYDSAWCTDTPVFSDTDWILQPDDREALQATWSGERYSESCEPGDNGAAGTYRASIAVAGIPAQEAVFTLVD